MDRIRESITSGEERLSRLRDFEVEIARNHGRVREIEEWLEMIESDLKDETLSILSSLIANLEEEIEFWYDEVQQLRSIEHSLLSMANKAAGRGISLDNMDDSDFELNPSTLDEDLDDVLNTGRELQEVIEVEIEVLRFFGKTVATSSEGVDDSMVEMLSTIQTEQAARRKELQQLSERDF